MTKPGDERLPPGQALTRKFPVVGEREPAPAGLDRTNWHLEWGGLLGEGAGSGRRIGWEEYATLPHETAVADIHCVTGWSRLGSRVRGIPLARAVAALDISVGEAARFVRFEAFSPRAHDTTLPLSVALADTWLIHEVDGEPLSREHGGPVRSFTPSRYFYKSLKWLRRVEFLAMDRLGYWERESAYHNDADPWAGDQRFTTGSVDPEEVRRFREASSYAPWHSARKILISVDLRGWAPGTRSVGRVQLKNCDLREARLARCDLRGANLSLSNLRGADLREADLTDADLEGVDFSGADLRGANLESTALSATKFFDPTDPQVPPARVEGMRFAGANGLLEDQEEFLRRSTG